MADYREPWHDDTDEETFRPEDGVAPVPRSGQQLLVAADVRLADGTAMVGFVTPSLDPSDISSSHPHVFLGDSAVGFWSGMLDTAKEDAAAFETAVGKDAAQILPIEFTVAHDIVVGGLTVVVDGWRSSRT